MPHSLLLMPIRMKCKKYYIQGPKKGTIDKFCDLPGAPDNIHYDGQGNYWIGIATEFTAQMELAYKYPFIRKAVMMFSKYIMNPSFAKNGGVIAVDLEGNPIAHYYDPKLSLTSGIKIAIENNNNNNDELNALLKFKEAISNDPHKILSSWNSSNHFCNWHGITCSKREQRVLELNLEGYQLQGFMSPHIGNLSSLQTLNLQNNNFYGKIPPELGHLSRLRLLFLANNSLAGEIPTNLTSCLELRRIYLQGNNLSGKIPMEIGSLKELQWLWLAKNHLSGKIPYSIWNLSSLVVLSLSYNNLEGKIPQNIGNLKHLQILGMVSNKLCGMLPYSLYNVSSLTYISAANNHFNGSLPADMFFSLPRLQLFEIGSNQMSGSIPVSITNATSLRRFDVTNNSFLGKVPSLAKLHDLWWLNFGSNYLGSYSLKDSEFLESLQNCSKLEILDISANNFAGRLPENIANFSDRLREIYLSDNLLFGEIPTTLGNHINLDVLTMELNFFIGSIPTTFVKFQTMKRLDLSYNKISGQIPPFIGNLSQLLELRISNNMLRGNIPPSIGNCKSLEILDLATNNLSGVIPPEVIGLSSLTVLLNLYENSLTGYLPGQVSLLKFIRQLDVSKNYLSGEIPENIGELVNLEYLNLQGNSFNGTIPSSLAMVKSLQHLDLSRNNLSGSIPTALQDLSLLEYLNVSFNMLDGEVPRKGVFGNSTAITLFGNVKLCGGISELKLPQCHGSKQPRHHSFKDIAVMIVSMVAFPVLLCSMFVAYMMRIRKNEPISDSSALNDLFEKVSYQRLHQATNGFSASNLIGSGNFGFVYKGNLASTNKVVAIKVLNLQKKGARASFMAECNALKHISHRNLVKILTCCSSTDHNGREFKALVFKYMENGSLDKWLHPDIERLEVPQTLMSLNQRIRILIDVASAISYLHYECAQPIVHCDLKPSNILLDDNMVAHVGDFGSARFLSKINDKSYKQNIISRINGTIGYTPPEYGLSSEVSKQGDTYSFGILVLEMLTGRRPTEETFQLGHNLHSYVRMAFPDKLLQIVDPILLSIEIEGTTAKKCLYSLFRIGLACSVESPKERMSMECVSRELNLIKNSL
ncbi:probable LRR receptor-like serine/threonine-protein kinase At3g47570 isoform X2 [Arachis stenosperma]|uniref:probable LRR receptor-like serine/threonine-protein kinase At3g47570 isoform X2 n=1 Tax=Arachis stenosperma TaxID=217475 RepID=UPI0025AD7174|nr:probable LRR receptor-like serine/threonine-protein kinase At3g47570 isoform X2 [Arachis stenosperma]